MAFRCRFADVVFSYAGLAVTKVPSATIKIYDAGTTGTTGPLAATLYSSATGVGTLPNPFTTGSNGDFAFYLDVAVPVRIVATGTGIGTLEADYVFPTLDPRDVITSGKAGFIYLLDYAGGLAIGNDSIDATTAIQAALNAAVATASSPRIVWMPPGIYRMGRVDPPSGVCLMAAEGGSAVLKRKASYSSGALWFANGSTDTLLDGPWVDGNASQNNGTSTGYTAAEVELGGTRNKIRHSRITNWNHTALFPYGQDSLVDDVTMVGQNIATGSYLPTQGTGASLDLGSIYGTNVAGPHFCDGLIMRNVRVKTVRSAGIVVGGTNLTLDGIYIEDCHRQYFPYQTAGGVIKQGGGQFALSQTAPTVGGTSGAQRPTRITVTALHIGSSTNLQNSGVDFDSCDDVDLIGCHIEAQPNAGFSLVNSNRIRVRGGEVVRASPGGTTNAEGGAISDVAVGIGNSTQVEIDGLDIWNHTIGVNLSGTNNGVSLRGVGWNGCTTNIINTSSDSNLTISSPRVISGAAVSSVIPSGGLSLNNGVLVVSSFTANNWAAFVANSATGGSGTTSDGLLVRAGVGSFDTVAALESKTGSSRFLQMRGDGELTLASALATGVKLNTTAAAALNGMIALQRSGSTKAFVGLTAADLYAVLNAAGNAANLSITDAGAATFRSKVISGAGLFPRTQGIIGYDGDLQVNVANGATVVLGGTNFGGLAVVVDGVTGDSLLAWLRGGGGTVTSINNTNAATWVVNNSAGNPWGIYYTASTYKVTNNSGSARTFSWQIFGA